MRCCFWVLILMLVGAARSLPAQWVPPSSVPMTYHWYADTVAPIDGNNQLCDYTFLGTFHPISPSIYKSTNMILDHRGDLVWWQKEATGMLDFKVHPNGWMSYNIGGDWVVLDTAFQVLDTLRCSQGYKTDVHDLLIQDGHYYIICTEDSTMDLRSLTTRNGQPGDSNATVSATVIQELNAQKQVEREWHAWDHFDIYDSDTVFFKSPEKLQLNHTNSIFLNDDGQMIVSHRFNHEVTSIDWASGRVLWRLGGGTRNEFAFPNDIALSDQHFAQMLPDGRLTVFDNGLYHSPNRARGIVYALDTAARIATKVWEYAKTDLISSAYGSFQMLADSSAVVNFGAFLPNSQANVAFLRPDSSAILEIKLADGFWTYRAQCLDLPFELHRPEISCLEENGQYFLEVDSTASGILWSTYETTPRIAVLDTGKYQVFVDEGIGKVGSSVLHVTDLQAPCLAVTAESSQTGRPRLPRLIGTYDLSGRATGQFQKGRLYIERYDDGSTKKIVRW